MPTRLLILGLLAAMLAACGTSSPTGPTASRTTCIDRPTSAPVASTCE